HRRVPGREEGPEGAMCAKDAAGGGAEGDQIAGTVEAIVEARERAALPAGVELEQEPRGGGPHALQRPRRPGTEEAPPAVGEARGEERDDLTVSRVGVAEGITDGVGGGAGGPVEPPAPARPRRRAG